MIFVEETDSCPICLGYINNPVILNCGHIYHQECIMDWGMKETTCPNCREPFEINWEKWLLESSEDINTIIRILANYNKKYPGKLDRKRVISILNNKFVKWNICNNFQWAMTFGYCKPREQRFIINIVEENILSY